MIFVLCLLVGLSVFASAQKTDDYKKTEFYAGYSNVLSDFDSLIDKSLNGFEVSGVYNLKRYFGVKGDFSAGFSQHRVNESGGIGPGFFTANFKEKNTLYNLLGGVQVKDNSDAGRIKPFVHAMIGVGYKNRTVSDYQCTSTQACPTFHGTDNRNGRSAAVGGGLDVKVKNGVQLRVFQIDYNPVQLTYRNEKNIRFGTGIVF